MTTNVLQLFRPASRATTTGVALLRAWRQRARSRRDLAQLDARLLRDIGLERAVAMREACKPFWRD